MNSKKHQFEEYRKFLLSRLTANSKFTSFVDHCLISEDEGAKHCFHKIMVRFDIRTILSTLLFSYL